MSSRVRWTPLLFALIALLWGPGDRTARAGGEDLHALVTEAGRLFRSGDYAAAQEKFAAAEVLAPENRLLAYNRGLAYQAAGDVEKAEEYYRRALLASDAKLNARTWFNLGDLEVLKARAKLGKDPVKVPSGARQEILDHLDRAVANFRSVLDAKPGDRDARYNIEVVRLYVKDLLDRWRKADLEKARKESNLVQYIEFLMGQQKTLERGTRSLQGGEQDTERPVRLEEIRIAQEELQGEMPHLRTKVTEHVAKMSGSPSGPGGPAGQPPPDPKRREALEAAKKQMLELVEGAETSMKKAVEALDAVQLEEASGAQGEAFTHLFTLWKGLADFGRMLARAIQDEAALIAGSEPYAESAPDKEDEAARRAEKQEAERLKHDQASTRGLVPLMQLRARQQLKQIASMPPPGGKQPAGGGPDPAAMTKAFKKALELLPKADEAMEAAETGLGDRDWSAALEKEKDAAKILKEIQELFKNDQQKKKDQQQKKNDQQNKKNDREKQAGKKPQEKQPRKLTKEEAQRLLQKMRENRKKREKQRRETRMGHRSRVDKDW